ncbi:hypothetical protein O5624_02560 [Escherichia coli]|nr:hypothetical protein [Escherichia coli]
MKSGRATRAVKNICTCWKLADENGISVRVQATLRGNETTRTGLLLAQADT